MNGGAIDLSLPKRVNQVAANEAQRPRGSKFLIANILSSPPVASSKLPPQTVVGFCPRIELASSLAQHSPSSSPFEGGSGANKCETKHHQLNGDGTTPRSGLLRTTSNNIKLCQQQRRRRRRHRKRQTSPSTDAGTDCFASNSIIRQRTMFSEWQLANLEWRFARNKYLTTSDRIRIAKLLHLNQLQVKTWFQVSFLFSFSLPLSFYLLRFNEDKLLAQLVLAHFGNPFIVI